MRIITGQTTILNYTTLKLGIKELYGKTSQTTILNYTTLKRATLFAGAL